MQAWMGQAVNSSVLTNTRLRMLARLRPIPADVSSSSEADQCYGNKSLTVGGQYFARCNTN